MQNFLANEYDRARALKRGGGRQVLSLDALIFLFGLTMAVALGAKAPLDYCVFTAAGVAFLLFAIPAKQTQPTNQPYEKSQFH